MKKLKRTQFLSLILLAFFILFVNILPAQNKQEIVVRFYDGVSNTTINNIKNEFNATELNITPISNVRLWRLDSVIHIPGNDTLFFLIDTVILDIKETVKRAKSKSKVQSVGENNDTWVGQPEEDDNIQDGPTGNPTRCIPMQPASCPAGDCQVKIGVIDTGVDPGNAYLNPWISPIPGYNFIDNTTQPDDGHGHGTHIFGTIAQLAEIENAFSVEIVAIKSQEDDGTGTVFDAIQAIDYAMKNELDIINMSLGYIGDRPDPLLTPKPMPLEYVINLAGSRNEILVVCSAGNEGIDIDTTTEAYYPAGFDCPNLISVASNDCDNQLYFFSNFGNTSVDLAAPGKVHSTLLHGKWGVRFGTSMSAAVVSAAAGLLATQTCLIDTDESTFFTLKSAILATVDQVGLPLLTQGILNAPNALAHLMPLFRQQEEKVPVSNFDRLFVYPQPFRNVVHIEWESKIANQASIKIVDVLGRPIYHQEKQVEKGLNEIQWNATKELSGTYWLIIDSGKEQITEKIIKLN